MLCVIVFAPTRFGENDMAAKKKAASMKKEPTPPSPKPAPKKEKKTQMGLNQALPKSKVNKKSQAGDLGSERSVMREAAMNNRQARKTYKEYGIAVATVTYRDKNGKLKNTYLNMEQDVSFPKSNYMIANWGNTKKKKK